MSTKYLIRDDGVVFIYAKNLAAKKNFRPYEPKIILEAAPITEQGTGEAEPVLYEPPQSIGPQDEAGNIMTPLVAKEWTHVPSTISSPQRSNKRKPRAKK